MPSKSHGNAAVRDALELGESNLANVVWVDEQPTIEQLDSDYIYMWIDGNDNLTVGSLNDAGDSILSLTLNVSVDSGDTGLIGGLL